MTRVISASSFTDFLKNNLAWIIVVATIITVVIIVLVTLKMKNKPAKYTSDEIDASVDKAAKEKAEQRAHEEALIEEENRSIEKQSQTTSDRSEPLRGHEEQKLDDKKENFHEQKKEKAEPVRNQNRDELKKETQSVRRSESGSEQKSGKKVVRKEESMAKPVQKADPKSESSDQVEEEESKRPQSYRILYDKETETWEVRKDNAKRVIRRVKTKKEALEIAKELSQNQDLNLVVHKKDGKFQKKR